MPVRRPHLVGSDQALNELPFRSDAAWSRYCLSETMQSQDWGMLWRQPTTGANGSSAWRRACSANCRFST